MGKLKIWQALLGFVVVLSLVPGALSLESYSDVDYQSPAGYQSYSSEDVSRYWPILANQGKDCKAQTDILLAVAPFGCEPKVVRSDLIAEQNVPVFCQLEALQINPLVDIKSIENIRFSGEYPDLVQGVGFHPARAALRSHDKLLGDPLINNVGYLTVVLKTTPREDDLPDFVNFTLTANVDYASGNILGVGKSEFILSPMSDDSWSSVKNRESIWNGRYFVRLLDAEPERAVIGIYDKQRKLHEIRVDKGELSRTVYVPGSYCQVGLQVAYDGFQASEDRAVLEVSDDRGSDRLEVFEGSKFLNDKCTVRDISVAVGDEDENKVSISCGNKRFDLGFDFRAQDFEVGQRVLYSPSGYFVGEDAEIVEVAALLDDGKIRILMEDADSMEIPVNQLRAVLFDEDDEYYPFEDASLGAEESESFEEVIAAYVLVAEQYPSERESGAEHDIYIGERALSEAIEFSIQKKQWRTFASLVEKVNLLYPESDSSRKYTKMLNQIYGFDPNLLSKFIDLDNRVRQIRLVELIPESASEKTRAFLTLATGVEQEVDLGYSLRGPSSVSGSETYSEGESIVDVIYDVEFQELVSSSEAKFKVICRDNEGELKSEILVLEEDIGQEVCEVSSIRLDSMNIAEIAKVRVLPKADNAGSEVNVSVGVGIEKRAIQLSPGKTNEMIENLNESIEKWTEISDRLSQVNDGLQVACLATGALLNLKNFVSGLDGEALARQKVMRGENGWFERCEQEVARPESEYSSVDACLAGNSDEIDQDVEVLAESIEETNEKLESYQDESTQAGGSSLLASETYDSEKIKEKMITDMKNDPRIANTEVEIPSGRESEYADLAGGDGKLTVGELLADQAVREQSSLAEIRDLYADSLSKNNEDLSDSAGDRVDSSLSASASRFANYRILAEEYRSEEEARQQGLPSTVSVGDAGTRNIVAEVRSVSSVSGAAEDVEFDSSVTHVAKIHYAGAADEVEQGVYLVGLSEIEGSGKYQIVEAYKQEGSGASSSYGDTSTSGFASALGIGQVIPAQSVSLNNKMNEPIQIKYYEVEPYKGMPAIVPFDPQEGWYAATRQTLPALGGIGAFDSSGRVTSFWLCNVGDNGNIDFERGFRDDICQLINTNTGQSLGEFPGVSQAKARELTSLAIKSITDAASQYGNKKVRVNGQVFDVGSPAVSRPGTQCQDFMSPKDCRILFNVCDPVICPTSRCDFGGTYPVPSVQQSGIVGSVFLCLPNFVGFGGDVLLPVCLTGIETGIDGFVSILQNHRDCLQESLDTGEHVGLCDQIYSVYLCEFFWRQAAPFVDLLIPKLFEVISGQGQAARGGGEYASVMAAWTNAKNSMEYFTQSYASNSIDAFKFKNFESIGAQVCKGFVSGSVPDSFESLTNRDSPAQFHATLSSTPYTDATVPSTSQYKVFYHIFAGDNRGVSYRIYLRGSPESSYYNIPATVHVASGFVEQGGYESESKDFTAPTGYNELCVNVDGDERCGFKSVSTSAGVNYLRDKYVQERATEAEISSEQECVSGPRRASSLGSALVNLNPQESFEEAALPADYERGIIRICATQNPGISTDPTRYVKVGNCGDPDVSCWLDQKSVENSISDQGVDLLSPNNPQTIRNQTLSELEQIQNEYLSESGVVLAREDASAMVNFFEQQASDLIDPRSSSSRGASAELIKALRNNIAKVLPQLQFNHHKAKVFLIDARLLKLLRFGSFAEEVEVASAPDVQESEDGDGEDGAAEVSYSVDVVMVGSQEVQIVYYEELDIVRVLAGEVYVPSHVESDFEVPIGSVTSSGLINIVQRGQLTARGISPDLADKIVSLRGKNLNDFESTDNSGDQGSAVSFEYDSNFGDLDIWFEGTKIAQANSFDDQIYSVEGGERSQIYVGDVVGGQIVISISSAQEEVLGPELTEKLNILNGLYVPLEYNGDSTQEEPEEKEFHYMASRERLGWEVSEGGRVIALVLDEGDRETRDVRLFIGQELGVGDIRSIGYMSDSLFEDGWVFREIFVTREKLQDAGVDARDIDAILNLEGKNFNEMLVEFDPAVSGEVVISGTSHSIRDTRELHLSHYELEEIPVGVESLRNLEVLDLGNNGISDLESLAGLTNLQKLDLANNDIVDLSPLADLTELRELDISYNKLEDLAALQGLTKLEVLYLDGNFVHPADLNHLEDSYWLRVLSVDGTEITQAEADAFLDRLKAERE